MKSVKVVMACTVIMLALVFAAACGSRDDNSDLLRANIMLQEELASLMHDFRNLMSENKDLQAELRYVRDYLAAEGNVSQSINGESQGEFPVFYQDFQSLLNETNHTGFSIEHTAWQNLSASSTGMQYILWRGSWGNLSDTQDYINLLVQNGWELVTMFGAGQLNGIVVVMRR